MRNDSQERSHLQSQALSLFSKCEAGEAKRKGTNGCQEPMIRQASVRLLTYVRDFLSIRDVSVSQEI